MGIHLSNIAFNDYLEKLSEKYRIFAPIVKEGKGKFAETNVVGYGEIKTLEEIEIDKKSYFSPKEIFYPIRETLFYFTDNKIEVPKFEEKPLVIFVRPCDLNGVRKLDTIFLRNGEAVDFYYKRRRDLVKFVMMECTEGFDTCFCVSMGSNEAHDYDAAIRFEDGSVSLKIVDDALMVENLDGQENIDFEPEFIKENKVKVNIPDVDKVTKETFNNEIWKEYTSRCIACGRCNTSCITCSCFTMQDVSLSDDNRIGERRRVWTGCHVNGFSDMAGGHSFRDKNGERMRFKTMHKINDFYKRFDEHMCVGCGRCDDVCPEYISFSKCINKLNEIVKEDSANE
ncbi:anaerobic sulfite reductase subunit AsrA [Helicovermis profundi]|uniref:Anaerobic sulfite reductase subunit AsrA n=1 Tax=Helicovermis profundi TaxID=3065157 RepID=A0AAU9E4A9_9FIRM|nr:anaerobic sulfite reductase subunit AsrA [Clostridia bacterium S502]